MYVSLVYPKIVCVCEIFCVILVRTRNARLVSLTPLGSFFFFQYFRRKTSSFRTFFLSRPIHFIHKKIIVYTSICLNKKKTPKKREVPLYFIIDWLNALRNCVVNKKKKNRTIHAPEHNFDHRKNKMFTTIHLASTCVCVCAGAEEPDRINTLQQLDKPVQKPLRGNQNKRRR